MKLFRSISAGSAGSLSGSAKNLFRTTTTTPDESNESSAACSPREVSPFEFGDDGTPLSLSAETSFSGTLCFADMVHSGGDPQDDENQQTFKRPSIFENTMSGHAVDDVSEDERGRPIENQIKDMEFVWVEIAAENLDSIGDIELMRALRRRNEGKGDVPEWLEKGLKQVKGPVDWLLKIRVPEGVKKGRKVAFKVGSVRVETRYGGKKSTGGFEVFALQNEGNKVKDRGFVWVNLAAERIETMKDIDLMRALENRNRGVKDQVPVWIMEGLAEVRAEVDWLLSVKIPPGVRKGQKITFTLHGEKVKAVYNGEGGGEGNAVFALLSRATASMR